jgi:hypothetical protein
MANNRELQTVIQRLLGNQGARLMRNVPAAPVNVPVAASSNGVARLMSPEESTTYKVPTRSNSSKQGGKRTRKSKSKRKGSKKSRRAHRK